jgi:hypothetical protein
MDLFLLSQWLVFDTYGGKTITAFKGTARTMLPVTQALDSQSNKASLFAIGLNENFYKKTRLS